MIAFRMMWKDWGFASTLYSQATRFLDLAEQISVGSEQEGYVRASIVFSVMSFEAFFFREIIVGYIHQHRATLDPAKVEKVEGGLSGRGGFIGIKKALAEWPSLLTGKALDPSASAHYFVKLLGYRNALTHGDITRHIPQWGKLAQDVETVDEAKLALKTTAELAKAAALHFGFDAPPWVTRFPAAPRSPQPDGCKN